MKWPRGEKPMMLLTTLNAVRTRKALWEVVQGKVKLEALANHVSKVSRKMYEAPEFFYDAIADGLRWLFVSHFQNRG